MNRFNSIFEAVWPWLVALPLTTWVYFCPFTIPSDRSGDFINGSLTISALLIGFLATSKSIMMAYKGNRVFNAIKASGHLKKLIGYLKFSIYSAMGFLGVTFTMYFGITDLKLCLWTLFGSIAAASFLRMIILQSKLIGE